MKLYLIRHGESVEKHVNPECPLSRKGESDIKKLATFMMQLTPEITHCYRSKKLRAQQTAELLKDAFLMENTIEFHAGLDPMDPIQSILSDIYQAQQSIAIVGHLPFLGKLSSALLIKDESRSLLQFEPGTLVCMERLESNWVVQYMIRPDLLP